MKELIAYFSWSGNTERLVKGILGSVDSEIYRIERKIPYSSNYDVVAYEESKKEVEERIHPEINDIFSNILDYDRILLFFPIWWYTIPMPVATFMEKIRGYKGKVILFANSYTKDPKYMSNSLNDLKKIAPEVDIEKGLFNKSIKEHIEFIKKEDER